MTLLLVAPPTEAAALPDPLGLVAPDPVCSTIRFE
jgi:hypothetical protein